MPRVSRVRADLLLVTLGLCSSRERARALILAGQVFSGDRRIDKAGEQLSADTPLTVRGQDMPYVSRGGLKLQGALDTFALSPADVVAADFGASTGGFTDCLLQRGAQRVYAIDVGYGQLHHRLRSDPRVVVMERTNARHLQAADLPESMDWVVIDASFIGLEKLLPAASQVLRPAGQVVALVKPQFQVGRELAQKTAGVVRDPALRAEAIERVSQAASALGFCELGRADAAVKGPKGNLEAFLWLRSPQHQSEGEPSAGSPLAMGQGSQSPDPSLSSGASLGAWVEQQATQQSMPMTRSPREQRDLNQPNLVQRSPRRRALGQPSLDQRTGLAREGGFEPP